ncbi:solute carrier family 35 member G1 isoform X4 [Heliangelus exortis]|uniref:solute carrier family 35 member G1 isoform X4 n=1 Tax=Heliangelus exortis TaxID=472823 RepID=UPI003A8EF052
MVPCQGCESVAVPAACGNEPKVPLSREDGAGTGQPCLRLDPGMEAAGAEERRGCGCCSGLSWPRCCKAPGTKKKDACPGLGLFYTVLSAFLFSVASLFLKKIEDVHSVEVSAIRCVFQMVFVLPGLIYYNCKSNEGSPNVRVVRMTLAGCYITWGAEILCLREECWVYSKTF